MRFSDSLRVDIDKRKQGADKAIRAILAETVNRAVMRSPVGDGDYWQSPPPPGYVGGRFRNAWLHSFDRVADVPEPNSPNASGADSIDRVNTGVARKPGAMHVIFNNLPYAQRIEEGWSRQAPKGIVALIRAEWAEIVRLGKQFL